jgi:hypothetical protein
MWNVASLLSQVRLASLGLEKVASIEGNEIAINSWRYGELELSDGKLVCIRPRWWPRLGSRWESMQDSYIRRLPTDQLLAYYAFPRRAPGFMSVLYAFSGPNTQYRTIYRAVVTMDAIAKLRGSQAIVCQTITDRASERLMKRWGYVRHAASLGHNHFIKRLR